MVGENALENDFSRLEFLDYACLCALADGHGIEFGRYTSTSQDLRKLIAEHFGKAHCFNALESRLCRCTISDSIASARNASQSKDEFLLIWLNSQMYSVPFETLQRLLCALDVKYNECDNIRQLRSRLKTYCNSLRKFILEKKHSSGIHSRLQKVRSEWPSLVPKSLKDKIIGIFREQTSSETLATATCASCAELCLLSSCTRSNAQDLNLHLLCRPDSQLSLSVDSEWFSGDTIPPDVPNLIPSFPDILIDPKGLIPSNSPDNPILVLCKSCNSSLANNKTPPLSIANHLFLGEVPAELKDLTVVEEAMIAKCRAKCWVLQLKEERVDSASPATQRGIRGHVIVYPQKLSAIASVLPPSLEEISSPICVLFVGSSPPTDEWLRKKAQPLAIRREKVRQALIWLKSHNFLYKDIVINHEVLDSLPPESSLPVRVEHIISDEGTDSLTSRYDFSSTALPTSTSCENETIPFENVVITDVEASAPSNELKAAALRHIKKKGGAYIEVPHDPHPINEFLNPLMFPMIYPTLFPYGIGGFENEKRRARLSLKHQAKHFFNLTDRRFQEHYSFLFTVFNILQRRNILLHTSLKVKRNKFDTVARSFASVSPEAIHIVSERVARGDWKTANSPEEYQVLNLMREVNVVTSHVPGSASSRVAMRNEIRGLMMEKGLPSFYLTINPADVYNPLVKFLGGAEIDIDSLLPEEIPNFWEQSILIAKNPFVAAKFFDIYMKAFISALLGYDSKSTNVEGGILGVVKAYYGCVEAQGRGTLHCHMLVWLEGGLNPNEIKNRVVEHGDSEFSAKLISFLDDTISNAIPEDPGDGFAVPSSSSHPCSVRGIDLQLTNEARDSNHIDIARQKDMHNLVMKCQSHSHSATCYKYWKGPKSGEPRQCRFDLDEANTCAETSFDPDTGELSFRHLDGLVNNFNATMLEAIRCNMDIQFIGSGASAKAVLYYITDYITKSQLKSHVAFSALKLAVRKLGSFDAAEDDATIRAKKLLQKCSYAMISHQELSAQQVSSYVLGFDDHYTSHNYRNLYWTAFEQFANVTCPLSDCSVCADNSLSHELSNVEENSNIQDRFTGGGNIFNGDNSQEHDEGSSIQNDSPEEISVTIEMGQLVARSTQVLDYEHRSTELNELCVWDSIAGVDKIRKKSRRSLKSFEEENNADDDADDDGTQNLQSCVHDCNSFGSMCSAFDLPDTHPDFETHLMKLRAQSKRLIPVPIGPSIPRRDRPDLYERYCRLMLLLFKPWRDPRSLRDVDQTWQAAFEDFLQICPPEKIEIMDNMQILHECKDLRNDHFSDREQQRRHRNHQNLNQAQHSCMAVDDFGGDNDTEDLILDHLMHIDKAESSESKFSKLEVQRCLTSAENGGLFQIQQEENNLLNSLQGARDTSKEIVNDANSEQEKVWQIEYERQYNYWKKKNCDAPLPLHSQDGDPQRFHPPEHEISPDDDVEMGPLTFEASVRQDIRAIDADVPVDVEEIIREFTLNREQARAFRIVAHHSLHNKPEPLRMYLGGSGGTGKSRVINALKDFFECRNQSRRFRLASYTGVAAKNISGMTLHAALCLNQRSTRGMSGKSKRDLIAMWEGVDYLFIDEVSMIGCRFLLKLSQALNDAKENQKPFGGMNVIFAGDFAQLPPVGDKRLFAHIDAHEAKTNYGQQSVYGKLLWLSIKTVVILKEVMRQSGNENHDFVCLLKCLREGRCTKLDYDLLNTRLLRLHTTSQNVPIVVSNNECKDALNKRATEEFARQTGRQMHWYYSMDTRGGKEIEDPALQLYLDGMNSGKTNQRMGRMPLVIGMPVMITKNFDVEHGVVNGCQGILKKVRYRLDDAGNRHALSCIVETTTTSGLSMPGVDSGCVAVLEDTVEMIFKHPYSKKSCSIKCTQIPLVPAFAMTAHKAQGQTLSEVIVDIQSCHGTESPYVMISRVTSLNGLTILRPFDISKIQCRQSEDTRKESRRLEFLRLQTVLEYGDETESAEAAKILAEDAFREHRVQIENTVVDDTTAAFGDAYKRLNHLQIATTKLASSAASNGPQQPTTSEGRTAQKRKRVDGNVRSHKRRH